MHSFVNEISDERSYLRREMSPCAERVALLKSKLLLNIERAAVDGSRFRCRRTCKAKIQILGSTPSAMCAKTDAVLFATDRINTGRSETVD